MKAVINKVVFKKEYDTPFGKMYGYEITYNNKKSFYSSKNKEQNFFIEGKEAEFTEEEKAGNNGTYIIIKPIKPKWGGKSAYSKEIKKEQSKYSGFAVSYAKDLCIAGKVKFEELPEYATILFNLMVELDNSIKND